MNKADEKYLRPIKRPLGNRKSVFNAGKKQKLESPDVYYAVALQIVQNDSGINPCSKDNFDISAFFEYSFNSNKPKALSFNSSDSSSISSSEDDRSVSPAI